MQKIVCVLKPQTYPIFFRSNRVNLTFSKITKITPLIVLCSNSIVFYVTINLSISVCVCVGPDQTPEGDFDFESNLAEFSKVNLSEENNDSEGEEENEINNNNNEQTTCVYTKDDFFDSISCDVLDKQNGIDNRLRGAAERSLNTETFGAVSLGTGRRGGRRNRRGRGGGRGRGGFGGGRGGFETPKENNRWKRQDNRRRGGHNDYVPRRTYGDGGLSRSQQPFAQSN